jgi:hypothetical protein
MMLTLALAECGPQRGRCTLLEFEATAASVDFLSAPIQQLAASVRDSVARVSRCSHRMVRGGQRARRHFWRDIAAGVARDRPGRPARARARRAAVAVLARFSGIFF